MDNKIATFEQFLAQQKTFVSPGNFLFNLILTALFAMVLSFVYNRYSRVISSRNSFSKNFVMIAVTTMIVISIVKSSLSLSLGLVGALSIVRFRTAIKEPEELSYIFYCIAIGLGFGADQRVITLIGFIFVILLIVLRGMKSEVKMQNNMILTISSSTQKNIVIDEIILILESYCKQVELKRFDKNDKILEASFIVDFSDYQSLTDVRSRLEQLDNRMNISFLNNSLYQ